MQPELQAIVVTNGTWLRRARRAQRLSNPGARGGTVQQVAKRRARVADVEAQIVRDADILNSPVKALARVAGVQAPVGRDRPVHARHNLVLFHRLDVRVDARVSGVDNVLAQVQLLDEPADRHARSRPRPWPAAMATRRGASGL